MHGKRPSGLQNPSSHLTIGADRAAGSGGCGGGRRRYDEEAIACTNAHAKAEKGGPEWSRALLADQLTGLSEAFGPEVLGFD